MVRLCFFALLAVILSSVLSPLSPKFRPLLSAGVGVVFFLFFIQTTAPVLEAFSLLTKSRTLAPLFTLVWKGLGISFLVSVCASFCRDLGEDGIAGKLELGGKGAVLCLSLPVLEEILTLLEEMAP